MRVNPLFGKAGAEKLIEGPSSILKMTKTVITGIMATPMKLYVVPIHAIGIHVGLRKAMV